MNYSALDRLAHHNSFGSMLLPRLDGENRMLTIGLLQTRCNRLPCSLLFFDCNAIAGLLIIPTATTSASISILGEIVSTGLNLTLDRLIQR
jgi:hypothetical protein